MYISPQGFEFIISRLWAGSWSYLIHSFALDECSLRSFPWKRERYVITYLLIALPLISPYLSSFFLLYKQNPLPTNFWCFFYFSHLINSVLPFLCENIDKSNKPHTVSLLLTQVVTAIFHTNNNYSHYDSTTLSHCASYKNIDKGNHRLLDSELVFR